ncbi:unnamed protein product [Hymenolepis diminuta]|uniref:Uncharacterized protein n=1 Tax=Hymenolepis diminuta TaxID=6216 RepID=A0A564Z4J4_HYMDI|nr:unnamed protein product [Hymenolepis diminuta]
MDCPYFPHPPQSTPHLSSPPPTPSTSSSSSPYASQGFHATHDGRGSMLTPSTPLAVALSPPPCIYYTCVNTINMPAYMWAGRCASVIDDREEARIASRDHSF